MQCKGGRAAACASLEKLKTRQASTSEPDDHFIASAWAASLPSPPKKLPEFKCALSSQCVADQLSDDDKKRVARWFSSLPRAPTLKYLRSKKLCSRMKSLGVSDDAMAVPVRVEVYVMDEDAKLSFDEVDPQPFSRSSREASVCARYWVVRDAAGDSLASDTPKLDESGTRFERIVYGTAPAPEWKPEGGLGIGFELLAGIPPAGQDFIDDTGSFVVRLGYQLQEPITYVARVGMVLPVGKNPFGLTLEFGGSFGVLFNNVVRWRPLQALAMLWFSFADDLRVLVAPSLSTSVDFAIGQQQLSLDVGARLPLSLTDKNALLPLELTVAPYAGLTFTPTF